jgi:hypothetical protein
MMRTHAVARAAAMAAASAALACPVLAQSPPTQLVSVSNNVQASLFDAGVEFAEGTVSLIKDHQQPFVSAPEAQVIGRQSAALLDNYNDRLRDARYGTDMLHQSFQVAIVAGTAMGSSTVAGAAVAIPVGAMASRANDIARDYLMGVTQARASAVLSQGLDKMSVDQRQTMDALLKANKYEAAATFFESSTSGLSAMKAKMQGDLQAQVLLEKTLTGALMQGSVAAIRKAGEAAQKADDVEVQLIAHTKAFAQFARNTAKATERLQVAVTGLEDDLGKLKGSVENLAKDQKATAAQVAIIQDILFDQQPPAVRLAMLDSGAKPGLTDAQRENLRARLTVQARQQEISNAAAQVVSYARDLNTIMQAVGVNSPELQKAIQYGSVASTALSQAFSGNYLGAVASVAGLFGGRSKPDPMAVYMRQIMQAFEQVNKKLDEVIKLQVQTLEAIDALARDVAVFRRETHARFDRIDFELARLSDLQRNLVWKDMQACDSAWDAQNGDLVGKPVSPETKGRYDVQKQRFRDLAAVISYTRSHGDKALRCYNALDERFASFKNPGNLAGNPFTISSVETYYGSLGTPSPAVIQGAAGPEYGLPALAYYRSLLYDPSQELLRGGWAAQASSKPGWGGVANAYALMTRPAGSAIAMAQRIRALDAASTPLAHCKGETVLGRRLQDYLCSPSSPYREPMYDDHALKQAEALAGSRAAYFLSEPLIRDQIGEIVRYTLFVERPRLFAKSSEAPGAYTLEELGTLDRDHYGRALLTNAMTMVDVSIAQQAMVYGDLSAWFIYNLLWDLKANQWRSAPTAGVSEQLFKTAKTLLGNQNNPWLQRNVLMLVLKSQERGCPELSSQASACGANNLAYGIAYDRYHRVDKAGNYAAMEAAQTTAAQATLLGLFRWAVAGPAPVIVVQDVAGSGARQLLLDLQGHRLPLPSPAEWNAGAFIYPPHLMDRLDDREILASRLAGYAALDRMSKEDQTSVLTILANSEE